MMDENEHNIEEPQLKRQRTDDILVATPADDAEDLYGGPDVENSTHPEKPLPDMSIQPTEPITTDKAPRNSIPGLALLSSTITGSEGPGNFSNGGLSNSESRHPSQFDTVNDEDWTSARTEIAPPAPKVMMIGNDNDEVSESKGQNANSNDDTADQRQPTVTENTLQNITAKDIAGENRSNDKADENRSNEKANKEDEYVFSSSDGDSSTSTDSSDSSSDEEEEEEEDYPLLTADEQAKILMREEVGEENDNPKAKNVRSQNEIIDEEIIKPDIVVTENMKIVELGVVEKIVSNVVLIKATNSGDYQVLGSDSVLCLEDRTVIGAVAETLGRVEEPRYSVNFSSRADVNESGLDIGTAVYYVQEHSTFVFTQPLKGARGTDASNQHDEEPNPDEMEFSDDEAEAEYKRSLKKDRKQKRDQRHKDQIHISQQTQFDANRYRDGMGNTGRSINYDNSDVDDDLYEPLSRPANLHEMMRSGRPSVEQPRDRHTTGGRRGGRNRQGRGNFNQGRRPRGPSNGHNNHMSPQQYSNPYHYQSSSQNMHAQATEPYIPEQPWLESTSRQRPEPLPVATMQHAPYSYPNYPQYSVASGYSQPPTPGNVPISQVPNVPISPSSSLPPGAHVNPAFFANQQQTSPSMWQQQQQQQPYQQQSLWNPPPQSPQNSGHWYPPPHQQPQGYNPLSAGMSGRQRSPESDQAFLAAQERIELLRKLSGGASSP